MTESAPSEIDPRFDPRFQRGYVPDAAAPAARSIGAQPDLAPPPAQTPPPDRTESMTDVAAPHEEHGDAVELVRRALAAPGPDEPVEPVAEREVVEPASSQEREESSSAPEAVESAEAAAAAAVSQVRLWFVAGWMVTAGVFVAGLWWAWAVFSDPAAYVGGGDMVLRQLGWTIAPALMQAGAIGIAVVTTLAGATQIASARLDASAARFPRLPAVYALAGSAVVSILAIAWLTARSTEGASVTFASVPSEEQVAAMALVQVASIATGPFALLAVGSIVGIVMLGARGARRWKSLTRNSTPPPQA
ncbi:hypothetical protein ACFWN7_13265 [Agromyces sp. NPDC058484]|uniref:hypothetical protein n=1 Tax=Agromyces sp. NPDC058484 TaxID=3346524 RepID=UPI00365833D1